MLPLYLEREKIYATSLLHSFLKGTQWLHGYSWSSTAPVTAGPLVEERLNPIHHLLAVLGGRDVQVHVAIPHVTITNHAGSTLPLQSFLVKRLV